MPQILQLNNSLDIVDYTQELVSIPNTWGTINKLGLFSSEGVVNHSFDFEDIVKDLGLLVDSARGVRGNLNKDDVRRVRNTSTVHFNVLDQITPADIKGKAKFGDLTSPETLNDVRLRKLERIRRNFSATLEYARAKSIVTGDVYAPSGTVVQNWYTEFGVAQPTVSFTFSSGSYRVQNGIEAGIRQIRDNLSTGSMPDAILVLCGTTFFDTLINHASVTQAFSYYSSAQEPLRQRLGGLTFNRVFEFGGVTFVEMPDSYAGQALIPATEAYFVPKGTDAFYTFYSPANRFSTMNEAGQEVYVFEKKVDDMQYEIFAESNFVNVCRRPAGVVKATMA